ncbi:YppG family protein [Virgibacillus sp. W0430]|uniref:YppG family protein n=1 Tax=Virgibacillus sp. W0430 TaxID=3391580 RepID=UPI003F48110A
MFPDRRRPTPPPPYRRFQRSVPERRTQKRSAAMPNLISRFRKPDGQFDLDKITEAAVQLNKLYGEVSPMISKIKSSVRK